MENVDDAPAQESAEEPRAPYVVPRYHADGDPAWYHALHGTVPGHQIDFMYCPDVPQGRLTQTHFGHLARLMKYIEPRQSAPYAFALGNLSRDDVQHEPGHGGLALIFALRVAGVTDHAGRAMPPYAHGVIAIDRALDHATLLEAIQTFGRRFLDGDARSEDATGSFYRSYVRVMREQQESVERFLHDYIADFDDLPQPPRSTLRWDWEASEEAVPKRVTIVHADDERFENLVHAAAQLGAMLYKSNIKWTTITSGREIEIPGGISIRLVPASEAPRDPKGLVLQLHELPDTEESLAVKLFGARSRNVEAKVARPGWREALGAGSAEDASAAAGAAARASNRPPPIPSTPPAQMPAEVSVDIAVDLEEAATIQAPLERDPAFDPRRSSPTRGVPSAFDPRRSSPVTGIAAAFDPRRSSSTTGVAAVSLQGASLQAASSQAASAPISVRVDSAPPPSRDALPSLPREAASADLPISERQPATRSRLGMWIGILGGLGVIVAIAVAVASGGEGQSSSASGALSSSAGPGSTAEASALPPSPGTTSAPASSAAGTATATVSTSASAASSDSGATAKPTSTGTGKGKASAQGTRTKPPDGFSPTLRIPGQ